MPRKREIEFPSEPPDTFRLMRTEYVRWHVANRPDLFGLTDAELGDRLGLSAGYVGMILSGARPPTKKFLDAIGWEAVTLYQPKMKRRAA